MQALASNATNRLPHWCAVLLSCATLPLIGVGGLVTSTDAGMAVPDWPSTYGYNLFLYPWETWVYGPIDIFVEHGHRLLGSLVGMLTIILVGVVFLYDKRTWMNWLSVVALLLVIAQGVLGGMRVLYNDRQLAMVHGCSGPAFFALTAALVGMTSRVWHAATPEVGNTHTVRWHRLTFLLPVLAYVQLVLGAMLRHLPDDMSPRFFQVMFVFHLGAAFILTGHVVAVGITAWREHFHRRAILIPSLTLMGLMVAQLSLGAATWIVKFGWPSWMHRWNFAAGYTISAASMSQALIVTAHVVMGSLILAISVLLATWSFRIYSPFGSELLDRSRDSLSVGERRGLHCTMLEGAQ